MKALLLVVLVIAALMLGHNYLQTGKVGFDVSLSEEEREMRQLGEELGDAVSAYRVAGRGTTIGGMAPDSDVETSTETVRRVERALEELKPALDTDDEKAAAAELRTKIASAKALMGINDGY